MGGRDRVKGSKTRPDAAHNAAVLNNYDITSRWSVEKKRWTVWAGVYRVRCPVQLYLYRVVEGREFNNSNHSMFQMLRSIFGHENRPT